MSLEAGGGIPCRPNPAATLLFWILYFAKRVVVAEDEAEANRNTTHYRYYMDAECRWSVAVQPSQTIRLTLLDFELDVRRAGTCHDYVGVTYRRRITGRQWDVVEAFRECGSLGKQVIDVPASSALVVFKTGRSSLTRRGFIVYYEGPVLSYIALVCRTERNIVPFHKITLQSGSKSEATIWLLTSLKSPVDVCVYFGTNPKM